MQATSEEAEGQARPGQIYRQPGLQVIKESFQPSVLFRVDSGRDMNSEKLSANTEKICLTNIMLTVQEPSAQFCSVNTKYPSSEVSVPQTRA